MPKEKKIKEKLEEINEFLNEEERVFDEVIKTAENKKFYFGCSLAMAILKTDFNEIVKKSKSWFNREPNKQRLVKLLKKKMRQIKEDIERGKNLGFNLFQLQYYEEILSKVSGEELRWTETYFNYLNKLIEKFLNNLEGDEKD